MAFDSEKLKSRRHGRSIVAAVTMVTALFAAPRVFAQADPDKQTQAATLMIDAGAPVHKSDLADSTDFSTSYRADMSTLVGKSKSIGLGLRYDSASTKYSQVDAQSKTQWTEFYTGYRYWIFYPKIIVGYGKFLTTIEGVDKLDAIAITRGFGLSLRVAFGASALAYGDFDYLTAAATRDSLSTAVELTQRVDADLGVQVRLPWDFLTVSTGYRYRTYRVKLATGADNEIETGPYVGLSVGVSP